MGNVNDAENCQKHCQDNVECKFWTYDSSNKNCQLQDHLNPLNVGTCTTCARGPKICPGKHTITGP